MSGPCLLCPLGADSCVHCAPIGPSDGPSYPDWYKPSKISTTHNKRVQRGFHPMGWKLSDDAESTCGKCKHVYNGGRFKKCQLMKHRWTCGEGTDLRLGWRGCNHFERDTDE